MQAESNSDESGKAASATPKTLMDVIVETVAKCSEEYDDAVHVQVIKLLLMTLTSKNCEVHEASLLLAVRSCFHIHLISKNPANKTTAKAALTQIMSGVFNRMEAKDAELVNTEHHVAVGSMTVSDSPLVASAQGLAVETKLNSDNNEDGTGDVLPVVKSAKKQSNDENKPAEIFPSVFHKDAFLIFRALCKLSMKGLQDESSGSSSDPIALQNKYV